MIKTKRIPEQQRIKTFPIQLSNYQIDFLKRRRDLFPLKNFNIWFRVLVKKKMKENNEWKQEFEHD